MFEKGKALLKQVNEYKRGKISVYNPKCVVSLLLNNKMVMLKSVFEAIKGGISELMFYDLVARITPKSKMFDFYPTEYADDFAITLERANALASALREVGYKVNKKEFLLVDAKDYEYFIKNKLVKVDYKSAKSKQYEDDHRLEYQCYKKPLNIKSIGDIIEGFRNDNINRNDKFENIMKEILSDIGVSFVYQKVFLVHDKYYIADFFIPDNSIIIEVDGEVHDTIEGLKNDRERDKAFARRGILTVRFASYELYDKDYVKDYLKKLLLCND